MENIEIAEKEALQDTTSEEAFIPVKFNKEIKNIPLKEAAELVQKGMKFDLISEEYKRLKNLAAKEEKAVSDYITFLETKENEKRYQNLLEECGGNEMAANRILELEKKKSPQYDFEELKESFPEIQSEDMLPQEVLQRVELSGGNILDAYLRYMLKAERQRQKILNERKMAEMSSAGPQSKNESLGFDAAANQFLKGIWGK